MRRGNVLSNPQAGRRAAQPRPQAGRRAAHPWPQAGRRAAHPNHGFRYTNFPRATISASSIGTHHNAAALLPQLFDTAISFVVAL